MCSRAQKHHFLEKWRKISVIKMDEAAIGEAIPPSRMRRVILSSDAGVWECE